MADIVKCNCCDGDGGHEYLISIHDDVTGWTKCTNCL